MKHYPIQYLRGIAAILVMLEHFQFFPFDPNYLSGAIGVDIFYIISGFIMYINIDKYVHNKKGFILNRVVRIYPLYLILSLPLGAIFLYNHNINVSTAVSSLFMIGNFSGGPYKDPVLFSGWSLVYEFIFYSLIIAFSNNRKVTVLVLCAMGLIGLAFTITNHWGYFFNQFYFLFAMGMLMHVILKNKTVQLHGAKLLLPAIILLLFAMQFNDAGRNAHYIPRQYVYAFYIAPPRVIMWGLPSLFFVISFYQFFINKPVIGWLNHLGNISFSVYLVHTFIVEMRAFFADDYGFLNNNWVVFILFLSVFPLSQITYQIIEVRLNRWLKNKLVYRLNLAV